MGIPYIKPGDKIKVLNGSFADWEGHVRTFDGELAGLEVRYRNQRATITVRPDNLQVIEPAPAPVPDVPGWEYYTPDENA